MLYKFLLILILFSIILACSDSDTTELGSTSTPLPARTLQQDIKEVPKVEPSVEAKDDTKFIKNPEPITTSEYEQFTQIIKEIKIT